MKDAAIDLHNQYDGMSAHELVERLRTLTPGYTHHEKTMCDDVSALESALRKAVIREASIGIATISVLQGRRRIHSPMLKKLPNGSYDLIPEGVSIDSDGKRRKYEKDTP